MYSGPIPGISKNIVSHGKILDDLASVLEEVETGQEAKSHPAAGFEGAIPLKNYHQMVRALRNEFRISLVKETLPEDLDLFSIFKVPELDFEKKIIPSGSDLYHKEMKTVAHRCFVAGISRYYNNILMAIQGGLSLVVIELGSGHPYLPIIKSAEELVQSGSYAISLLLGYLAERRSQTRRIRFNHLVAEVAAMQTYIPEEKDRQKFEQWIQQVPKMDGLAYLAEKCTQSFNRLMRSIAIWVECIRLSGEVENNISGRLTKIKELIETGFWISGKLLAFAGKGNVNLQKVALKDLLDLCGDEFRIRHPEIDLKFYNRSSQVNLMADPGNLNLALHELLQNAVESLPNGGKIILSVKKVRLPQLGSNWPLLNPGLYVMITIKEVDEGSDQSVLTQRIAKKDIIRVFDPFFTTKSSGKHLGLGLSIVHGVAKQLGGAVTINFNSDLKIGNGTKAILMLPQI